MSDKPLHTIQQFESFPWNSDEKWLKYRDNLMFPSGKENDEKLLRKYKRKFYERNIAKLPEEKEEPKQLREINVESEFYNEINKDHLTVVDFYATWCGPCKMIAQPYAQMQKEFPTVQFLKVDVDKQRGVAAYANVSSMPTMQLYRKGQKLTEVVGANIPGLRSAVQQNK